MLITYLIIIISIILLAMLFFIIGRMFISSTISITDWEPYISTWFKRFLKSLKTVLDYIGNKILKPFGNALIKALGALAKWADTESKKNQIALSNQKALNLQPSLLNAMLYLLSYYPMPQYCALNLTMPISIRYIGNRQYDIRFFLQVPQQLQPLIMKQTIPAAFIQALVTEKQILWQTHGQSALSYCPGLFCIRALVRVDQPHGMITTVDFIIEVF